MDSGAIAFFAGFAIGIGIVVVLIELSAMCIAELFSRKEKKYVISKTDRSRCKTAR